MSSICFSIIFCFIFAVLASDSKSDDKNKDVEIIYLNIHSQIEARFATTLITSKVNNLGKDAKEIIFVAQLPEAAFISNFSMFIDDRIIYGDVKEKEEAKIAFEAARSRGESAGHVAQKPRETNVFEISVNVAAQTKVTFNLTYQEILKRVHGVYKQVINLQPDQPVGQISVDINIVEKGEITNVKVPKFGSKVGEKTNKELLLAEDEKDADIRTNVSHKVSNVHVTYQPKQKNPNEIIAGQLVLLYDVKRDLNGGDIEVVDGYFVHFFAPDGLQKGNKHVVFVLDKSGSMSGRKFEQLKDAMKVILNDLSPEDMFNIIFFSSELERWKNESVKATQDNIKAAQLYVLDTEADGGTNIFDALNEGMKILDSNKANTLASMMLFLTDGQPTVGETNGTAINQKITQLNIKRDIINSIGFGNDADILLMRKISANNKGLAKKVYEDSDAAIQLTGELQKNAQTVGNRFYDEISTPLLSEVKIDYLNETVDVGSIVRDDSHNYFSGGEVVTFGKLQNQSAPDADVHASVSGKAKTGSVELKAVSSSWMCPRGGWGCCPMPRPIDDMGVMPPGGPRFHGDVGFIRPSCCWGEFCPHPRPGTTPRPEPLPANTLGGFIERMWAYQTIKKLLKQNELAEVKNGQVEKRKKQALELSLKYHFVTELTSMVVIKPNETTPSPLKETKDNKPSDFGQLVGHSSSGAANAFVASGPLAASGHGSRSDASHAKLVNRPFPLNGAAGPADFGGGFPAPAPPPPPPPPPAQGPGGSSDKKDSSSSSSSGKESESEVEAEEKSKPEKPKEPAKDTCHINLLVVRHGDKNDNQVWNQNFINDLFDDVTKNKAVDDSRFFLMIVNGSSAVPSHNVTALKANENDDLSKQILAQFDSTNNKNSTNVVVFLVHSGSMKYAHDAVSKLVGHGVRIFVVSPDKIDSSKKPQLLSIAGDFENLLVNPIPKLQHLSERFLCKTLYVWRTNF